METVRPIYKKVLLAAVVIYVVGTALLISDLCYKVGLLEFQMMHLTGACTQKHVK